ncbi:MAG TPA: class II aldolase/adducin family protein [Anaerolineales bacterium]
MAESVSLDLDLTLRQLGQVGKRLSDMGAAEGAAGNISVCFRESLDITELFPQMQTIQLPLPAPELAGATLVITGSGRRLREIMDEPTANLACIIVEEGGRTGIVFTSPDCQFQRVTSEFNSHLTVHHDQIQLREMQFQTILHAQPLYLTYLSHIPRYQDERYLNTHLLRWQPETILNMPEGIGVLPFLLPGSPEQMSETVSSMREHRIVVWSRHGIVTRAGDSILHALDLIEYAETAAHYEYLNLTAGDPGDGLSPENLRAISESWNVQQSIFD